MEPDRKPPEWRTIIVRPEMGDTTGEKICKTAQLVLDGRVGIIKAARAIRRLRAKLGSVQMNDPDFNFFQTIVTETAHLPTDNKGESGVEEYRLLAKKQEIQEYEASVSDRALQICRNLIERFRETPPNPS